MKKLISIFAVMVLSFSGISYASAEEDYNERVTPLCPTEFTSDQEALREALLDEPNMEIMAAAEGGHMVKVTTPVDEEFRARYSSWAWEVLRAVDDCDDWLGIKYNINYYIVSNKLWDSVDGASYGNLLNEAYQEWGLRDGAKLMIAFSGQMPGVGGVAWLDTPYCVVFDQGRTANTEVVQHETGHCYGLDDCSSSSCVMGSDYGNINRICSTHNTQWNNAKLKY
ncbi:MAG: hypothetical protein PHV32_05395 [Eubacteriales bacterium]|nr:hypothetical protein [Oscillospiraceae bacterium]MDD4493769.1 hypothetical protein [Eubacteriales bacterium]